ncbi:hypothetical protein CW304_13490 [Bacillus sp. UFRGS-B20]|nr:hypothetical protein CW304_13490 [Bacillus sp. UFRGS-B20]
MEFLSFQTNHKFLFSISISLDFFGEKQGYSFQSGLSTARAAFCSIETRGINLCLSCIHGGEISHLLPKPPITVVIRCFPHYYLLLPL